MNSTEQKTPQKSLKSSLFERIDSENVCPHSRFLFQGRECFVWFLWTISIVVGAFAVAVSLFVVSHHHYALYEATHDNFFTFIIDVLPYLWFVIFGLMVYVAVFNIRHTKHGYRYSVSTILLSSLFLSLFGGSTLQFFGFGYVVDDALGRHMKMYGSQEKLEHEMWQSSGQGRLLGKQVYVSVLPSKIVVFEDVSGQRWTLDVSELNERDLQLLASNEKVRLLGTTTNSKLHNFHACGAFPWMMGRNISPARMNEERKEFIVKMNEIAKEAIERPNFSDEPTSVSNLQPVQSKCSRLAVVRRMP